MGERSGNTSEPRAASAEDPDATITDGGSSGFVHLIPTYATAAMTCTGITAAILPWQGIALMGLVGHDITDETRPRLEIACEWPTTWLKVTEPFEQAALEGLHLRRLQADHLLATGVLPFANARTGNNPPDIVVDTTTGPIGIECTRWAVHSRQEAHGLFRAVRRRIALAAPERFANLSGTFVYMWFNESDSALAAPHRRTDEDAAVELVAALADYEPDLESMRSPDGTLPDPAPALPLHQTNAGAAFYAVPMVGAVPDTMLFNLVGFEVALAYTTTHPLQDELEALKALIERKDRAGSDWLLISVGAPDKNGITYPAEETVANFVLDHGHPDVAPEHLSKVVVHFWGTGRAVELWPERRELFGPMFQGITVSHRVAQPAPGTDQSEVGGSG